MTPSSLPEVLGSYLTIDQLAARSRLSKSTIYRLKDDGRIPYFQRCRGAALRFPPDALERAMAAVTPEEPAAPVTPPPKRLPGRRPRWEDGDS